MNYIELTERGEALAENSYVLWKAKSYLQKLSVSDDPMDYGVDRDQKESLLNDLMEYINRVAEIAEVEIPGEDKQE